MFWICYVVFVAFLKVSLFKTIAKKYAELFIETSEGYEEMEFIERKIEIQVWNFKADLDGAIFAYNCRIQHSYNLTYPLIYKGTTSYTTDKK